MTTTAETELLRDGDADLSELPSELDLIGIVRDAAEASDNGLAWCLHLDIADRRAPSLTFGVRNRHGFVAWWDGQRSTNAVGNNVEPVDYWSGGHHFQIEPGTEIDAEHVFAALGEFFATHTRPRCIRWNDHQSSAA